MRVGDNSVGAQKDTWIGTVRKLKMRGIVDKMRRKKKW